LPVAPITAIVIAVSPLSSEPCLVLLGGLNMTLRIGDKIAGFSNALFDPV